MSFSEEFFHQRSFEVVWAVFRVAEFVERPKLKHGLEHRALDYLLLKNSRSLSDLSEVVQLGFKIGEISRVNARVLLREIENLKRSLAEQESDEQKLLVEKKANEAPDIGEIFSSHAPMFLADIIKTGRDGQIANSEEQMVKDKSHIVEEGNNSRRNEGDVILPEFGNNLAGVRQESGKDVRQESGKSPASFLSPASSAKSPARVRQGQNFTVKERQNVIFDLLKNRKLCHINDIVNILPETSVRTIRYDIQRMVDSGEIERIGSGGPNSFFRLAQSSSE